jgi:NADPH-dependent curcumin reductase CurA
MTVTVAPQAREWHLVRRPDGRASVADFALVEVEPAEPTSGQVMVRDTQLSVERVPEALPSLLRSGTPTVGKFVVGLADRA